MPLLAQVRLGQYANVLLVLHYQYRRHSYRPKDPIVAAIYTKAAALEVEARSCSDHGGKSVASTTPLHRLVISPILQRLWII